MKTTVQIDTNAAKAIALDHLGVIAARLRSSAIKVRQRSGKNPLVPLDDVCISYIGVIKSYSQVSQILSTENMQDFEALLTRHETISFHLVKRASDDQAYEVRHKLR